MPRAAHRDAIYRRRRYSSEIIEQCVRWYLTYRLSSRDLVAMMAERGIRVSHTTILRWVQCYVPKFERRWSRFSVAPGKSWRMDETEVRVRGQPHWLYRAVDRNGHSVHSLLCVNRTIESAKAFFRSAVARPEVSWPATINLDGNAATHQGLRSLGVEDERWKSVKVRANRYLNNLIEQDHRAVKQRYASMLGMKAFNTAAVTFRGIELAHRVRKRQFQMRDADRCPRPSLRELWEWALVPPSEEESAVECIAPPMHQISETQPGPNRRRARRVGPRRHPLRVPYGKGLYLFVTPSGVRSWQYRYRYRGKQHTLSLGVYRYVPTKVATMRHQAARQLLAAGVDPKGRKTALHRLWFDQPVTRTTP